MFSITRKRRPLLSLAHRILTPDAGTRVIAGSARAYGIDISHWEESFDPDLADHGLLDFAIFKATEGKSWVDPSFDDFYDAALGEVPVLGAYHYLRSGMSGRSQADHFLAMTDDRDLDILVCDFESTNNTMSDAFVETAQEFGRFVKEWRPCVKLLFYTNPSIYDSVVWPACMRLYGEDVFTTAPWDGFWVAQYYFSPSPDKSPTMPDNRSDWVLWQYGEAGNPEMHGTGGWCDQNVFNGDLNEFFDWVKNGQPPQPPGDVVESWFDGKVRYTRGHRESPRPFNFHVARFKRSNVKRIHVNGLGFQGSGIYFFNTRGEPDIVINGGHADYSVSPPVPFAPVVSDGVVEKVKVDEVSIQFDRDHQPIGMVWGIDDEAYNVVGISDVLLLGGIMPASVRVGALIDRVRSILPRVDDTYVDPRNALFWNESEYILVDIDGRNDGTQGLTRLELAQFAQSLGALWGGNLDGGDSNTLIFKNEAGMPMVKNNPPDGKLHAVANHVGFWFEKEFQAMNGIAEEKLGKVMSKRTEPSVEGTTVGVINPGTQFEFVDYVDDLEHLGQPGYKWLSLPDGTYTNYIYPPNGLRVNILQEPGEDPPDPPAGNRAYSITLNLSGYKSVTHSGEFEPE